MLAAAMESGWQTSIAVRFDRCSSGVVPINAYCYIFFWQLRSWPLFVLPFLD
jgi:hypothetical protein